MCFPILFPGGRTGETPIIYYVLPHRVPRRAHCHWGNLYYLMGASPLDRVIGETSIIYYVLPHPILRRAPWGHPYYLLCASPSDRVPRRAHCHWGTLYYFVCASPSCSSASALPLGKPLLFSGCFPSYRCSRLGTDPDRGRCQSHSSGHWGNLYHLVGASPSYSPASALRKLLSFSRCFPIIFPGERIGER